MRADLIANLQQYQGRDYWVIKDPVSLKYFRFESEEYALLQLLDGTNSPDHIKRQFDYEFAPQKISMQELFQFVGSLYRSCLLVSDAADQGTELLKRGRKNQQAESRQSMTNILAIRFKGFDPDNLLGWMNRFIGWFFSWPTFIFVLFLGFGAAGLLTTHFETFQNKLPSFYDFFAAKNWFWLALIMALTKVIHEFGHGLACKKFGGQCHEMGFMMLVLTPCLYVNVSDSWLLNSKWKRAFIAAAGMYFELVLASIAVYVWWFSQPGLINQLALNTIFVCSVSTLLFNANPLLRYDGYYILSDLLEIPNLRQKATTILQRACGRWLLGIPSKPDPFLPTRNKWMFATYSIMAALYRWVITFSIFWFVYRVLEPYGLKIIGQLIAMSALYGLLGMPLIQAYKFFSTPGRMGTVKGWQASLSATVAVVGIAMLMLIPIPHYVYCSFLVEPRDAANVYVDVPGTLTGIHAIENQHVHAGDPLISLHSRDLEIELAQMQTTLDSVKTDYEATRFAATQADSGGLSEQEAKAAVATAHANFEQRAGDRERLVVRTPISGFLLRPELVPKESGADGLLVGWHGTPLQPRNRGAFLDQQTLVGRVIPDMTKMNAVLAIDQSTVEFIRSGQSVELLIDQLPDRLLTAETSEHVSPVQMVAVPKALSSQFGGSLITNKNSHGDDVPMSATYMVNVPLANPDGVIQPGSCGTAKIRVGSQTIGRRIWRLICHTFQFEL